MRPYFLCFMGLFIAGLAAGTRATLAETPVVEWTRQWGTEERDVALGLSVDASGNAYVTGRTYGGLDGNSSAGESDMFLTKYDTGGDKLWTQQLGTTVLDCGQGVSVDGNGNVYVTGYTWGDIDSNTSAGGQDMFLTKYNTHGAKMWTRQLGTAVWDGSYDVSVDESGNAFVTGRTGGDLDGNTSAGNFDMFLTKYDTLGGKLWTRQLGTDSSDYGLGVSVDGSGNAYVTGCTDDGLDGNTGMGESDMFLTKYDAGGVKLWTRQLGTANNEQGLDVSVDSSGNVYVAGGTEGSLDGNTSFGSYDMFLSKYDPDGDKLWTRQLGTAGYDYGLGVSVDGSGNTYVTGLTDEGLDGNISAGDYDIFLTKYDKDGTKLWTQQLGTAGYDKAHGVSLDVSGNAYITGWTEGGLDGNINVGDYDIVLIKISTIPEPGAATLLLYGLASLICWRRRGVDVHYGVR